MRGEGTVRPGVVGQGDVAAPHLVVRRADRDEVPSGGQLDGGAVLVALAHDRAVALGRHVLRERIGRLTRRGVDEARVVDVDDVVEVWQCYLRAEVANVNGDSAATVRTGRGGGRRGRRGENHDGRYQTENEGGDRSADRESLSESREPHAHGCARQQ